MTKRRKAFTAGIVILLVLASFPLAAYDVNSANTATNDPGPGAVPAGPGSPTKNASAGRFTTDVDNVLSLTDWSAIKMEKSLGFAGWANNMFALGYAGKIGGLYLGAWYNGNIVAAGKTTTEFVDVTYDTNGIATKEETGYSNVTQQPWGYTSNRVGALVGIGNMGIQLDVRENYLSKDLPAGISNRTEDKLSGKVTGTGEISEYKYLKGWTDVFAGFGTVISMGGGGGLNPQAHC
jgi:hypothetical protein